MAITHRYTLICDDIRQEGNGKFLILGLYTPDILVPAVPWTLPSLAFFVLLQTDAAGPLDFTFKLMHDDTVMSGGQGKVFIPKNGGATLPLVLGRVDFPTKGLYRFVVDIKGRDQIVTEFSVLLEKDVPQIKLRRQEVH